MYGVIVVKSPSDLYLDMAGFNIGLLASSDFYIDFMSVLYD